MFAGLPIAFLSSASLGMPGVGVAPGLNGFFNSASLGMPGVGVPFGSGAGFAEIPSTFAAGWIGLAERPGGMFAGSSLTSVGELVFLLAFVFPLAVLLDVAAPPHAMANRAETIASVISAYFNMK